MNKDALVLTELLSQEEATDYGALDVGIYVPNLDYPIGVLRFELTAPLFVSGEVQLQGDELESIVFVEEMNLLPNRTVIRTVLSTTSQPMTARPIGMRCH